MNEFEILLEKIKEFQERNDPDNYQKYIQRTKKKLSPTQRSRVKKMRELGVEEDRIQKWIEGKYSEKEKKLKSAYFRKGVSEEEFRKVYERNGVEFYMPNDEYDVYKNTMNTIKRYMDLNVRKLMEIRDILPIKKPKIIVKEIDEKINGTVPPAYYDHKDRLIYIDVYQLVYPYYLIHEYAHYIADLFPKQSEEILMNEYNKFLDVYFKKMKKKKEEDLSGKEKENLRKSIAKKLELPSPYGFTNFDEFFAEIISHWKKLPNNKASYKFKQSMKKLLTRLR